MKFFDEEVADRPVYVEEKVKEVKLSPFDWSRAICETKENLMVDEYAEKQYNAFMINRSLSMGADTVIYANEMNSRAHLDRKLQHDFLINIIRARKRFNKWIKAEAVDAVDVIKEYYGYSTDKARQVLPLLAEADIETMKIRLRKGGING